MKREKYIFVQQEIFTQGDTGGSRSMWQMFWGGWAKVTESSYATALEEGQWSGNKAIRFEVRKNSITEKIATDMRVVYRDKKYLIDSVVEVDKFSLSIMAKIKERNQGQKTT
jgi:head-tail adaptor